MYTLGLYKDLNVPRTRIRDGFEITILPAPTPTHNTIP